MEWILATLQIVLGVGLATTFDDNIDLTGFLLRLIAIFAPPMWWWESCWVFAAAGYSPDWLCAWPGDPHGAHRFAGTVANLDQNPQSPR